MSIEKQQGKEVLGVDLSPSVSVKDQFAVCPHVMLNACLALSWPDKSFPPPVSESAHTGGSNDVWGMMNMEMLHLTKQRQRSIN